MGSPLLPEELAGQFFGVGSLGEKNHSDALSYIKALRVPYTFQVPANRSEDMIRQFGSVIEGFEEHGDFVLDIDIQTFRSMTSDDTSILVDREHFQSLYSLFDGARYEFMKTQQTAPATMAFSIRDSSGRQHLSEQLFHFYCRLMSRIAQGQMQILRKHCDTILFCQDDPGIGHVKNLIDQQKAPDLYLQEMIARTDSIFPDDVIPAYHYCDDWRELEVNGWHALWDSRPKILHLDMLRYPPKVNPEQAEKVNRFLSRGGGIALGVLPNLDDSFTKPVLDTFRDNLSSALEMLDTSGVDIGRLARNAMVSTQCGLSGAGIELTREIHAKTSEFTSTFLELVEKAVR